MIPSFPFGLELLFPNRHEISNAALTVPKGLPEQLQFVFIKQDEALLIGFPWNMLITSTPVRLTFLNIPETDILVYSPAEFNTEDGNLQPVSIYPSTLVLA